MIKYHTCMGLLKLINIFFKKAQELKGQVNYPADHIPAMVVPKGGSCCANCRFLNKETKTCMEPNYINWNGSAIIPITTDQFC